MARLVSMCLLPLEMRKLFCFDLTDYSSLFESIVLTFRRPLKPKRPGFSRNRSHTESLGSFMSSCSALSGSEYSGFDLCIGKSLSCPLAEAHYDCGAKEVLNLRIPG